MKYPKFLTDGGLPMGSLADFEPGTVQRAKIVTIRLWSAWSLANTSKKNGNPT
jgi:hypothetical protein